MKTSVNIPAIHSLLLVTEIAYKAGNTPALQTALTELRPLVRPLPEGQRLSAQLRQLLSGQGSFPRRELDNLVIQIRSGIHGTSDPYLAEMTPNYPMESHHQPIARRLAEHFRNDQTGQSDKRALFAIETGFDRPLVYAACIQRLKTSLPELFRNLFVIIGSAQKELARKISHQMETALPDVRITLIQEGITEDELKVLKERVGRRRVLFILDDADRIDWLPPLVSFGLFDEKGQYYTRTRHYMLGGAVTLGDSDNASLPTVWGPLENVIYHYSIDDAWRQGFLVPVLGKIIEIDASQEEAAARAYLDNIFMQIGVGNQKEKVIRQGIGYAPDQETFIKRMRLQQELFDLVEMIFLIQKLLNSSKSVPVDTILHILGGIPGIERFQNTLQRFLYQAEWKRIEPLSRRVSLALAKGRSEGIRRLFSTLDAVLNVEARRIKGRRLIASATLRSFKDGKIDMFWMIPPFSLNAPMASLIVDNAPTPSRRELLQRILQIARPPDPAHPRNHSRKPEAVYIDLSTRNLQNLFGTEADPELRIIPPFSGRKGSPPCRVLT